LKDGEAESYVGVTVRYVHGVTAIMDIHKGGTLLEKVPLHTLKTKPEMHALMKAKGFVMKSPAELEAWKNREKTDEELNAGEQNIRPKDKQVQTRRQQRVQAREEKVTRLAEEREYLGVASTILPSYFTLFSLYGMVAAGLLCFCCARRSRRR
jgi:hypothetical protein